MKRRAANAYARAAVKLSVVIGLVVGLGLTLNMGEQREAALVAAREADAMRAGMQDMRELWLEEEQARCEVAATVHSDPSALRDASSNRSE